MSCDPETERGKRYTFRVRQQTFFEMFDLCFLIKPYLCHSINYICMAASVFFHCVLHTVYNILKMHNNTFIAITAEHTAEEEEAHL